MNIIGHLNLDTTQEAGSVIVQNLTTSEIISISHTDPEGNFEIDNLPDADLKFYGISGKVLDESEASEALEDNNRINYLALLPAGSDPELGVYINAASSLTAIHQEWNPEGTFEDSDAWTRRFLYGDFIGRMLSGYTTSFIAINAPASVFDADKFAAMVKNHGNCLSYCRKLVHEPWDHTSGELPFASRESHDPVVNMDAKQSAADTSAPSIPASANWAYQNPAWWNIIEQDPGMAINMKQMADTIDGIAYMAGQGSSNTADSDAGQSTLGDTLGDFAKWGKGEITGAIGSYVSSYLLNLCMGSIFGASSKKQEIINTLGKIRNQLKTIVVNQGIMVQDLEEIIKLLEANTKQNIILSLSNPVGKIQANLQKLQGYSRTQIGKSSKSLNSFANGVVNSNEGVYEAMAEMNTIIQQVVGINLPEAVLNAMDTGLTSNPNFYFITQQFFLYYASLQVQGAQLVVQANNYLNNATVNKLDSPLKISGEAVHYYNRHLIGGKRPGGDKPILVQQRDLYRSENEDYYSSFQWMVGDDLPSDLCVGLLPDVAQQNAPLFYNQPSDLILYGLVSQNLKNWTNGYDVISKNPGAGTWTLPPIQGWRYPTTDEWNDIIAPGKTTHTNDIFNYLFDEGFITDGTKSAFTSLWTRDSAWQNEIWGANSNHFNHQPTIPQPTNSAYGTSIDWWRHNYGGSGGMGHGPWNYRFTGSYPLAYVNNCSTVPFSSLILGDESYPWFGVSGGVMVTDASALQSPAKVNSDPTVFEYNQTQQIVYCDANNQISNLWNNNGQWTYRNLSELSGYNGEATGNPSVVINGADLYVFLNDTSGKLHCIQHNGSTWTPVDITTQSQQNAGSGVTVPAAQGSPSAVVFNSVLSVFYRDANNELSCIYLNGSQWIYYSPYNDAKASTAVNGDPFAYAYLDQLHVLYPGDAYMQACDVFAINGTWYFQILNTLTNPSGSQQGQGTVRGCQFSNSNHQQAHNVYWDENNHVADFFYVGQWGYQDLNSLPQGITVPDAAGNPVPFSPAANWLHVVYPDSNKQLSDLYWNGSQWNYQNLYELVKSSTGVSVPAPQGAVSILGLFFVVFRDENDELSSILYNGQDWVYQNLSQMAVTKNKG
ncbi:MAG: hypothetical protein CMI35_12360 [Owenweeksia sp.]|nr:hypothetical protein [Owenweeksia sp.]|tara:strand:- start:7272 stop:10604 length:3333 start_codon:yes stop_codon:yes gene_type:complete